MFIRVTEKMLAFFKHITAEIVFVLVIVRIVIYCFL